MNARRNIAEIDTKQLWNGKDGHMLQIREHGEPASQYHSYDEPVNLLRQLNLLFHLLHDDRVTAILKMRHGLEDGVAHTLQSIGQYFGITRERVRQIVHKRLQKLPDTTTEYLTNEMSKPFNRMLEANGGVMREDDIARDLPLFALLGNYHPAGVTRFVLSFANSVRAIPDRVWALKYIPLAEIEHLRTKAIEIVSGNLSRMHIKDLVSRISAILTTTNSKSSFIEACVRTCNRLLITDDDLCLLPRWQNSYIDDIVEILRREQHPMHVKQITEEVNKLLSPATTISDHSIYNRLLSLKDIFVLTEPRTFGLAERVSPEEGRLTHPAG